MQLKFGRMNYIQCGSKVVVKSIILEEEGHLQEMINQLNAFNSDWQKHAQVVLQLESDLFNNWLASIADEIEVNDSSTESFAKGIRK